MIRKSRLGYALSSLIALIAVIMVAGPSRAAEKSSSAKPNNIQIEYTAPVNRDYEKIYLMLKNRKALEAFQDFLSPLILPRPLLLQLKDCDGDVNAYYRDSHIIVCYEYIAEAVKNAPKMTTPQGVSYQDAVVGPIVEVFLHEAGHAVFHMLSIPIFGRVEDAADQFAAYLLLWMGREDARRTIGGVAFMLAMDAKVEAEDNAMEKYADEHGLAAQRFYNLLCLAYGADEALAKQIMKDGNLPMERADRCAEEYQQVQRAFRELIGPHLDPQMMAFKKSKNWLPPKSNTDWRDVLVESKQ